MQNDIPKTVLIVDEDSQLVADIASRCKAIGLRPIVASDSLEAVHQMQVQIPDLLCVDENLSATESCTFLERLGMSEETRNIPAIVLSSQDNLLNIPRVDSLFGYYVRKSLASWATIEMYINELISIQPTEAEHEHY